jgi:hypothetical protein
VLVNRGGRHPHNAALAFACLLAGVAGLAAFSRVASPTVQALPTVMAYGWFATMAVGGGITLAGLFYPFKGIKGLLVERGGLYLLAAIWYGYGLYLLVTVGLTALLFVLIIAAFATANVWRCRVMIRDEIKVVVALAATTHTVDELGGEP